MDELDMAKKLLRAALIMCRGCSPGLGHDCDVNDGWCDSHNEYSTTDEGTTCPWGDDEKLINDIEKFLTGVK